MKRWIWGIAVVLLSVSVACQEDIVGGQEIDIANDNSGDAGDSAVTHENSTEITEYIIKKGKHYSNGNWFRSVKVDQVEFSALFDSSAIYKTIDPVNQGDINKLFGVADCNDLHSHNSARFGWRWYNERLEIFAYIYVNGERKYKLIDAVPFNLFNNFSITFEEDKYLFKLNEKEVEMPRACTGKAVGYRLLPYFGGDESAPHEIKILISEQ